MKFKIESSAWCNVDEIIEHYPCLIKFGFEVEKIYKKKKTRIKDENGKIIEFEYDGELEFNPYIHINSVEELMELSKSVENPIIVDHDTVSIEIYDTYRE